MTIAANDTHKSPRAQYARALAGEAPSCAEADAPDFWTEAWREGVGALLWHAWMARGWAPDTQVKKAAEPLLRHQAAHTLLLGRAAGEVCGLLRDAGIEFVMLRGRALAETLYEKPGLRPQTDIDVLVRASDIEATKAALTSAGFRRAQSLLFVRGQAMLDVHVEPLGIERIKSWAHLTSLRTQDFFNAAEPGTIGGRRAMLTGAEVLLPYLCFHAMKHSFDRLIWLWDIALLARKTARDGQWPEVVQGVERFSLQRPCFYALSYVRAHLGASLPGEVLHAIQPRMGRGEQRVFDAMMRHEQVPFLAERVFARMQPDFRHRLAFWKETIWPDIAVRRELHADPSFSGGAFSKRMRQLVRAAGSMLLGR